MDKDLFLLQEIRRAKCASLQPRPNAASPCGYGYPDLRALFPEKPGEEVPHLERLADDGYLDRRYFDRIRLCPLCASFALNFREACPRCASTDVRIDPAGAAPQGRCDACGNDFPAPVRSCACLGCGQEFGAEKAVVKILYAYRTTSKAESVPAGDGAGGFGASGVKAFSDAILDSKLAVYTRRFYEDALAREITRAQRYRRALAVLLVSPDQMEAFAEKFGRELATARLAVLAQVIKDSLRNTDFPAIYEHDLLALLLPETSYSGAHAVADRIRKRAFDLNDPAAIPKITLSLGLACLTETAEGARSLMDTAHRLLREARGMGGNCVRPPAEVPAADPPAKDRDAGAR